MAFYAEKWQIMLKKDTKKWQKAHMKSNKKWQKY